MRRVGRRRVAIRYPGALWLMESICAASSRLARILLSTPTVMNAFEPLLKMAGMATEHIKALFDQVQKTKLIQAQELLAKRTKRRAEEARRATE